MTEAAEDMARDDGAAEDRAAEETAAEDRAAEETVFDARTVREAREIVARYPDGRSALLPMLHLVQSIQGYVSQAGMLFCAGQLELTEAEVAAVVTFYTMYKRSPCGKHLVSVCTNTLCAAMGGEAIYAELSERLGGAREGDDGVSIDEGRAGAERGRSRADEPAHEQTVGTQAETGPVTLEHAECLAACDLAPVLQVDYEYFDNQTVESARALVDELRAGGSPQPTRGPALRGFRSAERQLAGFFDGEAELDAVVHGPSTAQETVRGTELAEQYGWTAPAASDAPIPELEEG